MLLLLLIRDRSDDAELRIGLCFPDFYRDADEIFVALVRLPTANHRHRFAGLGDVEGSCNSRGQHHSVWNLSTELSLHARGGDGRVCKQFSCERSSDAGDRVIAQWTVQERDPPSEWQEDRRQDNGARQIADHEVSRPPMDRAAKRESVTGHEIRPRDLELSAREDRFDSRRGELFGEVLSFAGYEDPDVVASFHESSCEVSYVELAPAESIIRHHKQDLHPSGVSSDIFT